MATEGAAGAEADEELKLDEVNTSSKPTDMEKLKTTYGATLASSDPSLPSVYVSPMKGQMGTDIHKSIYEEVLEDINRVRPDVVVWVLECSDVDTFMLHRDDPAEAGKLELEHYRELVNVLKDDRRIRSIPQVMWVQDSLGISSVIAMAWSDMYMKSTARLDGLDQIFAMGAGWSDADVRAKMLAAWIGIGNGFLQNGGYPLELGEAMIDPTVTLSATWRGRSVLWSTTGGGEYTVDSNTRQTAGFNAKTAENFLISDGTADTLDDLMLLYGYREYRLAEGRGVELVEDYVTNWRRAFKTAENVAVDYNQHVSWASGADAVKWLGQAKSDLKKLLALFNRYDAVAIRMADFGWDRLTIEILIEQITDTIRALSQNSGGAGGAGGGRSSGGGRRGGG
jgi:hypothetical protein